jgi:hypothetical protein
MDSWLEQGESGCMQASPAVASHISGVHHEQSPAKQISYLDIRPGCQIWDGLNLLHVWFSNCRPNVPACISSKCQ